MFRYVKEHPRLWFILLFSGCLLYVIISKVVYRKICMKCNAISIEQTRFSDINPASP